MYRISVHSKTMKVIRIHLVRIKDESERDPLYGSFVRERVSAIKKENLEEEKRTKFKQKFLDACDGKSTAKTYKWIFENKLD